MTTTNVPTELLERATSLLCSYMSTLEDRAVVRHTVEELRALLATQPQASAAQAAPVVPEGWRLVPIEPTHEMLTACRGWGVSDPRVTEMVWQRMLAAAPHPAARQVYACPECGTGMEVDNTAKPAPRHDQGDEVRRLREAAAKADDVLVALTACTTPIIRLERKYGKDWEREVGKIRSELTIALSAQQQEGK